MLFSIRFHEPIRTGKVTLTFRRWKHPQARAGGRYRLYSGGAIEVTEFATVDPAAISDLDAISAGFDSADDLVRSLARFDGELYRIVFRYIDDLPDEGGCSLRPPTSRTTTVATSKRASRR